VDTEERLSRSRVRPVLVSIAVAAVVAALVAAATVLSGTINSANATLVLMGFDTNRAHLIIALLIGGAAAAAAALITSRTVWPALAGVGVVAALFGNTFVDQTGGALKATGTNGSFDLNGWLLTALALVMSGVISGWAGATLALAIRPTLAQAGATVRDAVRGRRIDGGRLRLPLAVVLVAILLVVSVPVFGDMVNFTTDARMLHGAPPKVGLAAGAAPVKGAADPTSSQQPWRSWKPSGGGSIYQADLPAPWKNTSSATSRIDIYTPPGYDRPANTATQSCTKPLSIRPVGPEHEPGSHTRHSHG